MGPADAGGRWWWNAALSHGPNPRMAAPQLVGNPFRPSPRLIRLEAVLPVADWLRDLDRQMHSAYCGITDGNGNVPSKAIYAVRAGEQWPWRTTGKRFLECVAAGVRWHQSERIAVELHRWMQEVQARADRRRGTITLFQAAPTVRPRRLRTWGARKARRARRAA